MAIEETVLGVPFVLKRTPGMTSCLGKESIFLTYPQCSLVREEMRMMASFRRAAATICTVQVKKLKHGGDIQVSLNPKVTSWLS